MKIRMQHLEEPGLLFGNSVIEQDPRKGLLKGGLVSRPDTGCQDISLGLVCLQSEQEAVVRWINRLQHHMINPTDNVKRFPSYPGSVKALGVRFAIDQKRNLRNIDDIELESLLSRRPYQIFNELVELYASKIESLIKDDGPRCVLVALPERLATLRISNPKLGLSERRLLERIQSDTNDEQLDLFDISNPAEEQQARELAPQADELLYRFFYRALKARVMRARGSVPIQVIRKHTYEEDSAKQNDATKAWNISVALAYKSREIPWKPYDLPANSCYIGISFHHLKTRGGDMVYASLAQAYSTDTEPYAIKGASIPRGQEINKRPYLKTEQAEELIERACAKYADEAGYPPQRIVVHKSSSFLEPEIEGFRKCLGSGVSAAELISMRGTGLRLLNKGSTEVHRGSLVEVENARWFLFTSGYVPDWHSYPGPHIPAPLELEFNHCEDIELSAREILALSKMNWNSAEGIGRAPVTISFAQQVGKIMTELEDDDIEPSYRYYM